MSKVEYISDTPFVGTIRMSEGVHTYEIGKGISSRDLTKKEIEELKLKGKY